MELKNIHGTVIFTLDTAKSILDLVVAASRADANLCGVNLCGANLCGANLCGANLCGANLRGANLCGVNLCGANLCGANLRGANLCRVNLRRVNLRRVNLRGVNLYDKKIIHMRAFAGLYDYQVHSVLFEDGSRWIRMGCLFKSLEEWENIGIRNSNLSEFPDDGSDKCEDRAAAFEFAKAAVLRMKMPELETK